MRQRYDLPITRYICDRRNCQTPIDVPSDTLYEFASAEDSYFWCPTCEDLPHARLLGTPAPSLPQNLQLLQQFVLQPVPRLEPSDDLDSANLMYRPYSQRSFLRQYLDWSILHGADPVCDFRPIATRFKKFDSVTQLYTNEIDYELVDQCSGFPCRFLRAETLKPLRDDEVACSVINRLCSTGESFRLCQTRDEAKILRKYLLISGGDHFPMMIPQPSILSGQRRADFLCFVPITKFLYQPVAVLVDSPGKLKKETDAENAAYNKEGYFVYRILVDCEKNFSYFRAARDLKNWVETQNFRST